MPLEAKKVQLGSRGFDSYFCAVDHPPYVIFQRKNILIIVLHFAVLELLQKGQLHLRMICCSQTIFCARLFSVVLPNHLLMKCLGYPGNFCQPIYHVARQ